MAELDPLMLIEDEDEEDSVECQVCGLGNDEDVLLLCDGCEAACHTFCINLDGVPFGQWFCENCENCRAREWAADDLITDYNRSHECRSREYMENSRRRYQGTANRSRTQAMRSTTQASRNRNQAPSNDYINVWRAIMDHGDINLDHPFDDGSNAASAALYYGTHRNDRNNSSRGPSAWERRRLVAQQQGAAHIFEETAEALLERPVLRRPRPELPEPESAEELLAWNAMEKAQVVDKDLDADVKAGSTFRPTKRKSTTTSPSDPDSQPKKRKRNSATSSPIEPKSNPISERRLKRPRTRRAHDLLESSNDVIAESSRPRRRSSLASVNRDRANTNTPTFLQSLLKEVESSTDQNKRRGSSRPNLKSTNIGASDYPSPYQSSPAASPTASNNASPRALSTTPPPSVRPGSPVPLTSKVEPVYPPAPIYSNYPYPRDSEPQRIKEPEPPWGGEVEPPWGGESEAQGSDSDSKPRQRRESGKMSLSTKEEVQKMVKEALKVPYKSGQLSKEEYTDINRQVSRMLYSRVAHADDLSGNSETYKEMARVEVDLAIKSVNK